MRATPRPVAVVCGAFFALYAGLALQRLWTFHHHTFDLALYARTAWGIAGGQAYVSLLDLHFLSAHASLPLIPLGLLGRLTHTPTVLLLAQAATLAAAALPLAAIGARRLGRPGAWLAAGLWFAYPNVGHVATYEFHPGNLAMLPLAAALDALDRRDARALPLWLAAMVACRADFALIAAMVALTWTLQEPPETRRVGIGWMAAAAAYFGVVALFLPAWLGSGGASAAIHFERWGGSPLGVIPALWARPGEVLEHFLTPDKLSYLPRVLAPLAALPLLRPRLLLPAAPVLALNLLSGFPTTAELYSHYLTPAVPVLVYATLAAIDGLAGCGFSPRPRLSASCPLGIRTREKIHSVLGNGARRPAIGVALGCALGASVWLGGLPWSLDFPRAEFRDDARTAARAAAVAVIPDGASVQAPDPLLPHLAERRIVHRAPPPERDADYVVLDVSHRRRFAGTDTLLRTREEPWIRQFIARPDRAVIAAPGDLVVLQRGRAPRAGLGGRYIVGRAAADAPEGEDTRLAACLSLVDAKVTPEGLQLRMRARGACPEDLAVRFGPQPRPGRAELLFDGLLSPAHLRDGDVVESLHTLDSAQRAALANGRLFVGLLRSSGAPPTHADPYAVAVPLSH